MVLPKQAPSTSNHELGFLTENSTENGALKFALATCNSSTIARPRISNPLPLRDWSNRYERALTRRIDSRSSGIP
jgi:hypothetical protein